MEVIQSHCAGLDVQKKTVFACCIMPGAKGEKLIKTHSFSNNTTDLLALSDWLSSNTITHIALDITGEDWKTVYHLLEANYNVLVVNAQRINDVPGRNVHTPDAEWMAQLLRHGLVRNSFIHPVPQRDLRDLLRHRHYLVQERTYVVNRLYQVLESAKVKLESFVSDLMHISARAMLVAIAEGEQSDVADLTQTTLRQQQQTYFRHVRTHHRFLIANHLNHIDFLDQQISVFNAEITDYVQTKITRTVNPEASTMQKTHEPTSVVVHTTQLIPSWEEALAAFLKGDRI